MAWQARRLIGPIMHVLGVAVPLNSADIACVFLMHGHVAPPIAAPCGVSERTQKAAFVLDRMRRRGQCRLCVPGYPR